MSSIRKVKSQSAPRAKARGSAASQRPSGAARQAPALPRADMYTQENRIISVETPLGRDKLLLRSFSGQEAISRPSSFHLEMLSVDPNINFKDIVGQNITVRMQLPDQPAPRFFNGYVSRFVQLPREGSLARYQAEMVPWIWFLSRTADCLIFSEKLSVPEIVKRVFTKFGFNDFEERLQRKYDPWEYCVQYRETSLNFVMRLLEQEGIFFFFKHEEGKHTLVLADHEQAHEDCPQQSGVRFDRGSGEGALRRADTVNYWQLTQQVSASVYALNDYNFQTPDTKLLVATPGTVEQGDNLRYEIFDYPGEYERRREGADWSKVRIEEEEAAHRVVTGSGNCTSFISGHKFKISGLRRRDQNGDYVLTTVNHSSHVGGAYEGGAEAPSYVNDFTCIPYSVPFRPPRVTPKPVIYGCQTATVVGDKNEEIDVDEYGSVLVKFHWDRRDVSDEERSCRIRVSQPWAGKHWGAISLPRIGQEVVVEFLEGDPDRPIITGRVYNFLQRPPYDLPDNKTQSGIKSRSSLDGGSDNFNELRFEDKKGEEEVYLHAEKNMTFVTENDKTQTVGHDESLTVVNDRTKVVQNDEKTVITGNRAEIIEKGNETITLSLGNRTTTLPQGNDKLTAKNVHVKADVRLVLEGPGGVIVIDSEGVTIQGVLVKVN